MTKAITSVNFLNLLSYFRFIWSQRHFWTKINFFPFLILPKRRKKISISLQRILNKFLSVSLYFIKAFGLFSMISSPISMKLVINIILIENLFSSWRYSSAEMWIWKMRGKIARQEIKICFTLAKFSADHLGENKYFWCILFYYLLDSIFRES